MFSIYRFMLILSAITLLGCIDQHSAHSQPTRQEVSVPQPLEKPERETRARMGASTTGVEFRDLADVSFNPQTQQFLKWAHSRYAWFCSAEFDDKENITIVNAHPCYPVSEDELAVISGLKKLESLAFYTNSLSDKALQHLRSMPALRRVIIWGTTELSAQALEDFKRSLPNVEIDLTSLVPTKAD